jgi:pimeloyl-ACP methyl ester carboxylesterase
VRVRVRDIRLYFDVEGMGLVPDGPTMRERPTIVCLHGGPGFDHSTLKPFLAPLADSAQLVFLDHRGQGRSDESSPDRWNLDTWIEDLRGFCEVLGIEKPTILGQSFGGMVALGLAIRHPELLGKLIVSSSTARFREDRALAMFERLGGEEPRLVAERFFHDPNHESFEAFMTTCLPLYTQTPPDPDVRARMRMRPEVGFHFFRDEIRTYDWFGELDRVRVPTLVLAGELDPITTVADHEEMVAAIQGSRLEVFQDAGHGVFRDKPDDALAVIRDFVLAPVADSAPTST